MCDNGNYRNIFKERAIAILQGIAEKVYRQYEDCKLVPPDVDVVVSVLLELSDREQDFIYYAYCLNYSWDRTLFMLDMAPSRAEVFIGKIFSKLCEALPPFIQSDWRDKRVDEIVKAVEKGYLEKAPQGGLWSEMETFSRPPFTASLKIKEIIERKNITPIEDLDLGGRATGALRRAGVCTINQLEIMSRLAHENRDYCVSIVGLGRAATDDIVNKMHARGCENFILPDKKLYPR